MNYPIALVRNAPFPAWQRTIVGLLEVGKKWATKYTFANKTNENKGRMQLDVEVLAYERLRCRLGRLMPSSSNTRVIGTTMPIVQMAVQSQRIGTHRRLARWSRLNTLMASTCGYAN